MKKWLAILAGLVIMIPLAACGNKAVATTSGGKVTESAYYSSMKSTSSGKQVLQQMILNKVLEKEYGDKVKKSAVTKEYNVYKAQYGSSFSSVLSQSGMTASSLKEQIRSNLLLKEAVKDYSKITQAQIDKQWKKYEPSVTTAHILVASEDDANAVIDKLNAASADKKWSTFKKLAKSKSTDTTTASTGGKLSAFDNTDTTLQSKYRKAAFQLKTGEYTTSAVKTSDGYEIIYMIKHPAKGTKKSNLNNLKDQIVTANMSNSTKLHNVVSKVLKKGNVSIKDSDLKSILDDYLTSSSSSSSTTSTTTSTSASSSSDSE
ncbi:peptidylprolyl isomerase [Paucilactobacillus oligofermentans DSM 15707 = LMG 22743]|uniref:Foldase protein PrsA n=1 Tax=Paucilactobacillus oligofermentans DSM 15707 = LMG 22743 TaxID=1423778 RepID=A0A0R1RI20_9LACO|nr:peptidylprolyl isomerase [Paucilactobacillus oligofermentans]KRL55982.1 peptidylprolyl isomerase [Paucilactobacillus oligofermentans DSM 15707 = LMG 22743]CUS26037.1 Foldase protein PrsA [Paucilactobacillus oligofermentans DSM 15707 = LMG 22743]